MGAPHGSSAAEEGAGCDCSDCTGCRGDVASMEPSPCGVGSGTAHGSTPSSIFGTATCLAWCSGELARFAFPPFHEASACDDCLTGIPHGSSISDSASGAAVGFALDSTPDSAAEDVCCAAATCHGSSSNAADGEASPLHGSSEIAGAATRCASSSDALPAVSSSFLCWLDGSLPSSATVAPPKDAVSCVAALSCSCTSCALIRACSSGLSLLHGMDCDPSASFRAGASVTPGPKILRTSARTMLTTSVVPSTDSLATALAKAYLLSGLSNLIHRRLVFSSSRMRGTFSRFT